MVEFSKVKLVIWDLDDTFWKGTLSEESVSIVEQNVYLVKMLADYGIVNSICSKNNEEPVYKKLKEIGIDEYFVFNSINWENKGGRVKATLKDMGLRPQNTLFIDDNHLNIKEVEFYNPGIMTAFPDIIVEMTNYFEGIEPKDKKHKRLDQYKVLEKKRISAKQFASNEEFLVSCNVRVQILHDWQDHLERLHELVLRTNQLNFTKKRPDFDTFKKQLEESDDAGYVRAIDNFGDYGIVGFYLIKNQELAHFLFSCRTIGQGVELYVYDKLSRPKLTIVGDVTADLQGPKPYWISELTDPNVSVSPITHNVQNDKKSGLSILFKGPCDMRGMLRYLQLDKNVTTEFTFFNNSGHSIETHNHSAHIMDLMNHPKAIQQFVQDCVFIEDDNFRTDIFKHHYDVIFLSTLCEGHFGRYKQKNGDLIAAFGYYTYPLTDSAYWEKYLSGDSCCLGYNFTKNDLLSLKEKYDFIGRTSPEEYIAFLNALLEKLPTSHICLILGSEIPFEANQDPVSADRHLYHKELNSAIRAFALQEERVHLVEISSHIGSQLDFTNNINHFTPSVYHSLSTDILDILNKIAGENRIKSSKMRYLFFAYVKPFMKKIIPKSIIDTLYAPILKKLRTK